MTQHMELSPDSLEALASWVHKELEHDPATGTMRLVHEGVTYTAQLGGAA